MIAFPLIEIGGRSVQMRELSIGQAIEVAKVPQRLNEAALTRFLAYVLDGDASLARDLTVQERYYLLIQYLALQDRTPLDTAANHAAYLAPRTLPWNDSLPGLLCPRWRQLNGHQVELIELVAEDVADWMLCAIALQACLPEWPELPEAGAPQSALQAVLNERHAALTAMPASDFEALASEWHSANMAMARFLRTGFDNQGIVVLPENGGADDAPARFRPLAALGRFVRELAGCFAGPGQPDGEGLPDDDAGSD